MAFNLSIPNSLTLPLTTLLSSVLFLQTCEADLFQMNSYSTSPLFLDFLCEFVHPECLIRPLFLSQSPHALKTSAAKDSEPYSAYRNIYALAPKYYSSEVVFLHTQLDLGY